MDDSDLPLVVPISSIADYFQCSICMCQITSTVLTTCGHRYCDKCISEWVNRRHTCPCCNSQLSATQLIKDHQFDNLIGIVDAEKEKSETQYFESLINSATDSGKNEDNLTPVENVLKKHLKEGLLAHEKYFQSLKKSYKHKLTVLDTQTQVDISDLQSRGISEEEILQQTVDLQETLSRKKDDLLKELNACSQMVADAYDKYLSTHIPSLDVLPVTVKIYLSQKNLRFADIVFKPSDCVNDIRKTVEGIMVGKENPVIEWGNDVRFFLFGPFAKCTQCEMDQIMSDILSGDSVFPDVQLLTEDFKLGLQYGMKPGSEIVIYGTVKMESDLPKRCFIQTFIKGGNQKVDYFSCHNCGFKWICRSCMNACHQGHNTVPYIMQHQPAWACCYCPKKKKCTLQTTDF